MKGTDLDHRIDEAIRRASQVDKRTVRDASYARAFQQSAIGKAEETLRLLTDPDESPFSSLRPVFVSIGGADGTEVLHLLTQTDAKLGVLIELDPEAAAVAKARAEKELPGKSLHILVGDAAHLVEDAIDIAADAVRRGDADYIAVTCHAVIHELYDRSNGFSDLSFLATVFRSNAPTWFTYREPGVPEKWPLEVLLAADCRPESLCELAQFIAGRHARLEGLEPNPVVMGESVRLHRELAMETLVKLFYLDSLVYEIEERSTAVDHQRLQGQLMIATGLDSHGAWLDGEVIPRSKPTGDFRKHWTRNGVSIRALSRDHEHASPLPIPENQTRVVAWRSRDRDLVPEHFRRPRSSASLPTKLSDRHRQAKPPVVHRIGRVKPVPTNLKPFARALRGRVQEIREVTALIADVPLVTLRGPPGVGKSDLAAMVAWQSLGGEFSGVWFVEAKEIDDATQLVPSIASVLGIATEAAHDKVPEALESERMLLVINNVEHLLPEATQIIGELAGGRSTCLVTSQPQLGLVDDPRYAPERAVRVNPLPLPPEGVPVDPENPAVAMFIDRAQLDTEPDLEAIGRICRLMAGLPLAIHLASGRTASMQEADIAASLDTLASDGGRGLLGTLDGALEWSYELISPEARHLLGWLAVFPAGFGLDVPDQPPGNGISPDVPVSSVQELWNNARQDSQDKPQLELAGDDLVQELVMNGLLEVDRQVESGTRYTILAPIERFARARLGDGVHKAMGFLVERCQSVAREAKHKMGGHRTAEGVRRLEAERPNMARALDHLQSVGDHQSALRLCLSLSEFWVQRGDWAFGQTALDLAISGAEGASALDVAEGYCRAGGLARNRGEPSRARACYENARAIAGRDAAFDPADEDEARRRDWIDSYALNGLGRVAVARGPRGFTEARDYYEASLRIRREMARDPSIAICLVNLGDLVLAEQGSPEDARVHYDEAHLLRHAYNEHQGDIPGIAISHLREGQLQMIENRPTAALMWMCDALQRLYEIGYLDWTARAYEMLGHLAAETGDMEAAATMIGVAMETDSRLGTRRSSWQASPLSETLKTVREAVGSERYRDLQARGSALTAGGALQLALERRDMAGMSVWEGCSYESN